MTAPGVDRPESDRPAGDRPEQPPTGRPAARPGVDRLGARLREEREKRGVSVRGLAREVGVSASMISQIETGKVQPSVSTLYAVTTALGVTVEDLFNAGDTGDPVDAGETADDGDTGDAGAGRPGAVADRDDFHALRGHRLGPLVRPGQRRVLRLDSGVTWELLGELPNRVVDFLLVTYAPGGTSSSGGGQMRHPGCEYGYLLSGELVLRLGFEEMVVRAGDSISFDSTVPHSYRNEGDEPAVGVWFVMERGW